MMNEALELTQGAGRALGTGSALESRFALANGSLRMRPPGSVSR